jgi:hypothetical protein
VIKRGDNLGTDYYFQRMGQNFVQHRHPGDSSVELERSTSINGQSERTIDDLIRFSVFILVLSCSMNQDEVIIPPLAHVISFCPPDQKRVSHSIQEVRKSGECDQ